MKKSLIVAGVFVLVAIAFAMPSQAAQKYEKSDLTALIMSTVMPGAGEWYNSDFQGNFPLGECLVGEICVCVKLSSIIDATAGDTSVGSMRLDFWSNAQRQ